MAMVEILKYGKLPGSPGATAGVLGRSSGINQDIADEVVRYCKGWGQPPVMEKSRPAILSFPLKAKAGFAAQGAYAVVKIEGTTDPTFQVAVLNQGDYAAFGYNPFAILEAGVFPAWDPGAVPGRRTLKRQSENLSISPPPSPADVGMVDEALHQLLTSHKLYLPIEKATAESDRCLALLLEVMPVALKQQMRFASYAPSPANGYHLAATVTSGCEFSGWQRMMMTLVGGALPDNLDRYVKKVRDCLAFGDLEVIRDECRTLPLGRQGSEIKHRPAPQDRNPIVTPVVAATPPKKTTRPKQISKQPIRHGGDKANLARLRGGQRQLPGAVIGMLVMAVSLGVGWTYLEFFHGGGGIEWNELVSLPGQREDSDESRVASLLEVPNVGSVYDRQIKKIHRAGLIPGMNQETDQRRGLVNLKNEAAVPLLGQIDLFLELSAAGIRQGSRPDRESERLKALVHQGRVLEVETARLELGWHSLSSGVNWNDLKNLSDTSVAARRDSLRRAQPSALRAAAVDMNFEDRSRKLNLATKQVAGMSQLLVLFQTPQWSSQWSRDLYKAAEMVSPSASSITRAYRNSAFTLVRLKNAEHVDSFLAGAFVGELGSGIWPGEKVADILPGLKRETGKFSGNEVPPLLAGTLEVYQCLNSPLSVVDNLASGKVTMEKLENNPAVLFDPEVYGNYLERLYYQAGLVNPDIIPQNEQQNILAFESFRKSLPSENQWDEEVARQNRPFLTRWARYEQGLVQQNLLSSFSKFDAAENEVKQLVEKIRGQAAGGKDWTAVWVDLDDVLERALTEGQSLAAAELPVADRVQDLEILQMQLRARRLLQLKQITVRLDQINLSGPEKAVFEFQTLPGGEIFRSETFVIGPAAPTGSGWVGSVALSVGVQLSAREKFQGIVRSVVSGRELVRVLYPALGERVGPGALARPRTGEGGSLLIKIEDNWWSDLSLPGPKEEAPTS